MSYKKVKLIMNSFIVATAAIVFFMASILASFIFNDIVMILFAGTFAVIALWYTDTYRAGAYLLYMATVAISSKIPGSFGEKSAKFWQNMDNLPPVLYIEDVELRIDFGPCKEEFPYIGTAPDDFKNVKNEYYKLALEWLESSNSEPVFTENGDMCIVIGITLLKPYKELGFHRVMNVLKVYQVNPSSNDLEKISTVAWAIFSWCEIVDENYTKPRL